MITIEQIKATLDHYGITQDSQKQGGNLEVTLSPYIKTYEFVLSKTYGNDIYYAKEMVPVKAFPSYKAKSLAQFLFTIYDNLQKKLDGLIAEQGQVAALAQPGTYEAPTKSSLSALIESEANLPKSLEEMYSKSVIKVGSTKKKISPKVKNKVKEAMLEEFFKESEDAFKAQFPAELLQIGNETTAKIGELLKLKESKIFDYADGKVNKDKAIKDISSINSQLDKLYKLKNLNQKVEQPQKGKTAENAEQNQSKPEA